MLRVGYFDLFEIIDVASLSLSGRLNAAADIFVAMERTCPLML